MSDGRDGRKFDGSDFAVFDGFGFRVGGGIPVSDRGFRYGMSTFETVAVFRSRALLLDEHLDGFELEAGAVGFDFPKEWRAAVTAFLLDPPVADGVVRLILTAGDGGPLDPPSAGRLALHWEAMTIPGEVRRLPVRVQIGARWGGDLPSVKSGCYWPNVRGLQAARAAGFDEALRVDRDGIVLGAMMANVILVRDGLLVTPRVRPGVRAGAVRAWVGSRFDVSEQDIAVGDLAGVALILTNSRIGVLAAIVGDGCSADSTNAADEIWRAYRREVMLLPDE